MIDSCRVKEKKYDPTSKLESLEESWCSQAASRQRRGRYASLNKILLSCHLTLNLLFGSAGRVRAGVCWHLVTSSRMEKLEPFQIPEMRRVPLDELCLQIRLLKLGTIRYAKLIDTGAHESLDTVSVVVSSSPGPWNLLHKSQLHSRWRISSKLARWTEPKISRRSAATWRYSPSPQA